ncbi:MAG: GntR family transcriptional regulator [Paracoccaceae bacterium]
MTSKTEILGIAPLTHFPPAGMGSATQVAYQRLRQLILTGELAPGEKLKIERLRGLMDMGSSPVREALSLLTSDHLVERLDQRGFRAAPASAKDFAEILRLRCDFETMALRQSIANATDGWARYLKSTHQDLVHGSRADMQAHEARNKVFHMALIANCESPLLLKYCSQLYDLNIRYRYLANDNLPYPRRDISHEHEAILAAAVNHNFEEACALLVAHYQSSGETILLALDSD